MQLALGWNSVSEPPVGSQVVQQVAPTPTEHKIEVRLRQADADLLNQLADFVKAETGNLATQLQRTCAHHYLPQPPAHHPCCQLHLCTTVFRGILSLTGISDKKYFMWPLQASLPAFLLPAT
jgi:hypothetical protein